MSRQLAYPPASPNIFLLNIIITIKLQKACPLTFLLHSSTHSLKKKKKKKKKSSKQIAHLL